MPAVTPARAEINDELFSVAVRTDLGGCVAVVGALRYGPDGLVPCGKRIPHRHGRIRTPGKVIRSPARTSKRPSCREPDNLARITAMSTNSAARWLLVVAAFVLSSASGFAQTVSFVESNDFAVGAGPVSVAVGDFNGDGVPDLAVASFGNSLGDPGGVSVLLGNSDGTLQTARSFAAGSRPTSVAVGHFNLDEAADLAVANSSGVTVLLGNGDGTFQVGQAYAAGANPRFITVGDFNLDTLPDLVVANFSSNNVSVLLGNADGTFQAARTFAADRGPSSV